jgi:hypothetical protein
VEEPMMLPGPMPGRNRRVRVLYVRGAGVRQGVADIAHHVTQHDVKSSSVALNGILCRGEQYLLYDRRQVWVLSSSVD